MPIRTLLSAAAVAGTLAAVATLPLAGVAEAQPGPLQRDCRDFASQAAAESALRSHSGDPQRLDPDHDGMACEDYFTTSDGVVAAPAPVDAAPADPAPADQVDAAPVDTAPAVPTPDADPTAVVPAPADPAPADPAQTDPEGAQAVIDHDANPRLLVPPLGAPVRTVPERQILAAPRGAADTGDGSTSPDGPPPVLLVGGLSLAVIGAGYRLVRRAR